jgi:protein-disulfide isomerase
MTTQYLNKLDHCFGKLDAEVTLVVYEDYECEYCEKTFRELKQLYERFKEQICVVYRHFPFISMHPWALSAALVVEACALQNKFLQAHDLIFERQEYLEYGLGGILRLLEKEFGVSIAQLHEDLKKDVVKQKIANDVESGIRRGITRTPAVFINGRMHAGSAKFDAMAKTIERLLSKDRFPKRLSYA